MTDREEILKALQVIKSTCEQYDDCEKCPLRIREDGYFDDYGCALNRHDNPTEWKLKPREENWRAFED